MFSASKTAAPAVSGSYAVKQSLRFRGSASAYLNRTSVASPTNNKIFTISAWVKRGAINDSNFNTLFGGYSTQGDTFGFGSVTNNGGDSIQIRDSVVGGYNILTTPVYRDPSAWYHLVVAIDTTQATASNRVLIYVNGTKVTSFSSSSYPSQNYVFEWNAGSTNSVIGRRSSSSGIWYFDGYLAEVNFIDGQALSPSSFGTTNATTGVWQPARYTGSYGTNGFYLTFGNKTSTTTLGNDTSGNGNNWTTNNISLTAGSTYDSMLDSPTNYDDGGNGVGNYAVLNPLDKSSYITNSDGNLAISTSYSGAHNLIRSTISLPSSGKFYAEMTFGNTMTGNPAAAFALIAANAGVNTHPASAGNYSVYGSSTTQLYSGGTGGASVTGMTTGQVWQFAVNVDGGNAWIGLNNAWYNVYTSGATTGNPSTGTNPTFSGGSFAGMFFGADLVNTSAIINLGQRPFSYTPPSGFKALNTQNLPTPAIVNGSAHMNVALDTGANIKTTSQALYTYYLEWIKDRANANNHQLADTVRGNTAILQSNTTAAETTYTAPSGNSVGWVWNANAAAVTNSTGTITSQVSANPTAGFSVVTYTGTGANATVGHGLGVAPSFIIVKPRNGTTTYGGRCYHVSLGPTKDLVLNNSDQANSFTDWNNTNPTSSVVNLGSGSPQTTVENGTNYVMYCFAAIAGYSAFGSYTGNGSTDGPFVFTGFQPKFVLVKCSSTSSTNWYIFDSARNTYNVLGEQLEPNLSNAGSTVTTLDFLSNGFKLRIATDPNAAQTYIYAAFASSPFKNSLAF